MQIKIAKTAGFCMGVRRAVEMAIDAANKAGGNIYSYGPLIHNPQVLDILKEKGIPVLDEIPEKGEGIVIIRAHGVPPESKEKLKNAGFEILDASCPRVIRVQTIIGKYAKSGHKVIIAGDEDHPEVIGLLGYAGKNGYVIDSLEKLDQLPLFDKAIIVAQTTQNINFYNKVDLWAKEKAPHYKVFNTICDSTDKRQAETLALAKKTELILVVGGKNSGNTQRLAEIAREAGTPSLHIESVDELKVHHLEGKQAIGISAGASTPNWVLRQTVTKLEQLEMQKYPLKGLIKKTQRFLLSSNIYLAICAAFLSYTASFMQQLPYLFSYSLISAFYILSMQIFNTLAEVPSDHYNHPERAFLYEKNKNLFFILASFAGLTGLFIAFNINILVFLLILFMSFAGISYSLPLFPKRFKDKKIYAFKDIPGSKTLLISIAWGIILVFLPVLGAKEAVSLSTFSAFIFISVLIFTRTAFFDLLAIQGDRIVGKETLPILLGQKNTLKLLEGLLSGICIFIFFLSIFRVFPFFSFLLVFIPFSFIKILGSELHSRIDNDITLMFYIESLLILLGILSYIAGLVS